MEEKSSVFTKVIKVLTGQSFNLFQTIYFNFKYLPFSQAIRLPIWVFLRHRSKLKGKIIIEGRVHFGMIKLGKTHNNYYPKGFYFENDGIVILRDGVFIGNESKVIIKRGGVLDLGENVGISSSRIICAKSITIGAYTMLGNDCEVFDCDFHLVKDEISGKYLKPYGKVSIGTHNWFGFECMIMKGAVTPDSCIVSARTLIKQNHKFPEHCIIGGNPVALIGKAYSVPELKNSYEYYPKWEEMVIKNEIQFKTSNTANGLKKSK